MGSFQQIDDVHERLELEALEPRNRPVGRRQLQYNELWWWDGTRQMTLRFHATPHLGVMREGNSFASLKGFYKLRYQ